MSLRPQHPIPPVPTTTAGIARAAFPAGNPYLTRRDRLGAVFTDGDFADLYPECGQPACAPWRLALVTLLQFREGLSDRRAAEAVRGRIDWKYLLSLELGDAGFDHSVLCEFRGRLLAADAGERLLARVLDAARTLGLLKMRSRQRTDATHVLAAVRDLNRIELVAETLRAALNAVATVEPDWLRAFAPSDWLKRYGRRIEDARLPEPGPEREASVRQVGEDGYRLLEVVAEDDVPESLASLPAVEVLRRVWARHFERSEGGPEGGARGPAQLRPVQGRGPGDRIESPYDIDARFRTKGGMGWTGYMAHLTEACDEDAPHLVVHADTTPANVHEATRTEPIHKALAGKGLAPAEHLVDAGYVSAEGLISARARYGIDLVGPGRPGTSWQDRAEGAFAITDFTVAWDRRVACCPEGHERAQWRAYRDKARGPYIRIRFSTGVCAACPSKARCTHGQGQGRQLRLHAREVHEALATARARQDSEAGWRLHAQRQGVEATISQVVRAFDLRRARYRGLAKARLQHVATAAALNLDRLAAWLQGRPLAPTRVSRLAALAA